MSCCVWGCTNNNPTTADASAHYYLFPKIPTIAQQWLEACGWTPDEFDITTAQVCSLHFDEESYTTEVKTIDYMTCYAKVLKYDAIPTLFLPLDTQIVIKEADAEEELRNMMVFEHDKEYLELQDPELEIYKKVQTEEQLLSLRMCNKTLREKISEVETKLKTAKDELSKITDTYIQKDHELFRLKQMKQFRNFSIEKQKTLLRKVFSEPQIKILSGKKKIYWSNDDMAVAYTIKHLSNKSCYLYLSKKLNIPLPAVSSVKRWMTLKNGEERKSIEAKKGDEEEEDDSN